jgi:hypothetical protein
VNAERATSTYEALQRHLYDRRTRSYRKAVHRWSGTPETLWPYANAWSATCALAGLESVGQRYREDLGDRLEGVLAFTRDRSAALEGSGPVAFESRVAPPHGEGGETYYDDNAWVALAALHQHRITGDGRLLRLAERVFAFLASGWSEEERWAHAGGMRWASPTWSVTRNTCSTAPAAEVAALLHQSTGERSYLDWAVRAYEWTSETLGRPDGLYADRVEPDGTVHGELWSYNQGTTIGAALLLHESTGDQRYLDDAERTGAASVSWISRPEVHAGQGPPLVAIYLRNLLLLDQVAPDSTRAAFARSYAERMWDSPDHRRDGLFVREDSLLNPTAGMISILSLLAGSPPHP